MTKIELRLRDVLIAWANELAEGITDEELEDLVGRVLLLMSSGTSEP